MEADWSVEIGPGLPLIDASWDGCIYLRSFPEMIDSIQEAAQHSAIREALLSLNGPDSPLLTTKCDWWMLSETDIDPDEFTATRETARAGFASYIDVVERDSSRFSSFEFHEGQARELTSNLRNLNLRHGRVDLVLRAAAAFQHQSGFAITLYAAGCGPSESEAYAAWQAVLAAAVAATIAAASHPPHAGE